MYRCTRCGKEYTIEYYFKNRFCECGKYLERVISGNQTSGGFSGNIFVEDIERAVKLGSVLHEDFQSRKGIFKDYVMPEYVLPNAEEGSRELALYYTYIMALDKQVNAERLWASAVETYDRDPSKFEPTAIIDMSMSKLENFIKEIGGRYYSNQAKAWKTISRILVSRYQGDPRNITQKPSTLNEVLTIIDSFPELRGEKLSRLYLRVMGEKGLFKLTNLKELDVAVDIQVCRFTFYTGALTSKTPFTGEISQAPVRSAVTSIWRKTSKEIGCGPYELDQPIWSLASRYCTNKLCNGCPVEGHCLKRFEVTLDIGQIKIPSGEKEIRGILPTKVSNIEESYGEITSLDQYQTILLNAEGFIVITDTATPSKVHKPTCRFISTDNFIEKVILNRNRNGAYYWIRTPSEAKKYRATQCSFCFK